MLIPFKYRFHTVFFSNFYLKSRGFQSNGFASSSIFWLKFFLPLWSANSHCWSCPDELPPPAELRSCAAHRHPLPERLSLELNWGSASRPVCDVQGLEWGGVWVGRRTRARCNRRLLLGMTLSSTTAFFVHIINLLGFQNKPYRNTVLD